MSERVRSPKEARRLVESAAMDIAAMAAGPGAPEERARVTARINAVRRALGRKPIPEEAFSPEASVVMQTRVRDAAAGVPLARPTPLDEGGMNQVLRTWELFAGREVAVRKHLPPESAVAATLRELRDRVIDVRLSRLPRHPVIQRFWATGALDGERCELFDFAPGTNLIRQVARAGLTTGALLDLALHAARGLAHLHAHGLVHADVKPENFCVEERATASGEVTMHVSLIDFDIVSTPEEQVRQYLLGNGLEGTLAYMPPENFGQDAPTDAEEARRMIFAKDVYALGLTLYRALAGDVPRNFQLGDHELLLKKMAHEEARLDFPAAVPHPVRALVARMAAADWTARPTLAEVIAEVRAIKAATTSADRAEILVRGTLTPVPRRAPRPKGDLVGPYRLVNREFAQRLPGDGQTLPLAELEDPMGRRLVGVPYVFDTEEQVAAFYAERGRLLSDLNGVRLRHPELFPGSFRDLVRTTTPEGRAVVWILRPLLVDAIDLNRYLGEERPQAATRERISILRRIAEGLAALEEGGYTLTRLTAERVFFIPQSSELHSPTKSLLTRPVQRIFDVPGKRPGQVFRQELMGTASARRIVPGEAPPAVADFIELARTIGVTKAMMGRVNLAAELASAMSWSERADLLRREESR